MPTTEVQEEQQLKTLLQSNRRKGITQLFERYYTMMVQSAYRIVNREELAEDLVQEIFVKLHGDPSPLLKSDSLGAYMRRTAVNRAIDHYRKESRQRKVDIDQVYDLSASERTDHALAASEMSTAIKAALDQLPQQCRVVFLLKRKEGFTNAEVAEFLGISVKTVENQVTKAMKRLRHLLGPLMTWLILIPGLLDHILF